MNGMVDMVRWCGRPNASSGTIPRNANCRKMACAVSDVEIRHGGCSGHAAIIAVAMNVHVRTSQYEAWHNTPGFASPDSAYLFSTTDAPYFLRLAGALKRGETNAEFESLLLTRTIGSWLKSPQRHSTKSATITVTGHRLSVADRPPC